MTRPTLYQSVALVVIAVYLFYDNPLQARRYYLEYVNGEVVQCALAAESLCKEVVATEGHALCRANDRPPLYLMTKVQRSIERSVDGCGVCCEAAHQCSRMRQNARFWARSLYPLTGIQSWAFDNLRPGKVRDYTCLGLASAATRTNMAVNSSILPLTLVSYACWFLVLAYLAFKLLPAGPKPKED